MVSKITDKKISRNALIILIMLYLLVYIGRYNYNSSILNLVSDGVMTKTQSGTITSLFYVFFGAGAFFAGFLTQKTSPFYIILIGTFGAAIANLLMYFSNNFASIAVSYSLNGLSQSMIFPSLLTVFATYLLKKHSITAIKFFSLIYPIARFLANVLIILFMELGNYRYLYIFSFVTVAVTAVIWLLYSFKINRHIKDRASQAIECQEAQKEKEPAATAIESNEYSQMSFKKLMLATGFLFIFIPFILRSMINAGTNTWIPTMFSETYKTSVLSSQIATFMLPLANVVGIYAGIFVLKKTRCELTTAIIFFTLSLVPLSLLFFMSKITANVSIIIFVLINIITYGYFYIFNAQITAKFANTGRMSQISGITSAVSSLGFILAGVLYGVIADNLGWTAIKIMWLAMTVVAVIFSIIPLKRWQKFIGYTKKERVKKKSKA